MSKYLIVIEKAGKNYSAFCPDMPGCIATGSTAKKAERNIQEAIEFHLNGLKADGDKIPRNAAQAKYILV